MSRRICLALAAMFPLAVCNLVQGQDTTAAPSTASSPAPTGDEVTKLQAENTMLKKEVAGAKRTIAQLQAKLAQAGKNQQASTAEPSSTAPVAADGSAPGTPSSTNAAPTGPQKALPLDAPNPNVTAAAPGTPGADAGPSRSYTVVKGDSLWKIAHKMYPGDTKNGVDKIEEANKDAIGGKPLKIGQVLIIPQ